MANDPNQTTAEAYAAGFLAGQEAMRKMAIGICEGGRPKERENDRLSMGWGRAVDFLVRRIRKIEPIHAGPWL
ncbi:hypothetical protein [Acidocella sp.]|uniref:hypothetical protein n=1 Tax=Acidocella sp. TaxID=50710 RepID=UPI0026074097|nr:hypothetical protein [Acidocella sp.]